MTPAGQHAHVPRQWDDDPSAQLCALRAEVLRQKDFPDEVTNAFMASAAKAIDQLPANCFPPERAEALCAISRFFYNDGQTEPSISAAANAVAAAVAGNHRKLEMVARARLGIALRTAYDFFGSMRELVRALEIARAEGDGTEEAKLLNSLGNTYNDAGLQHEALALFQRAAVHFQNVGDGLSAWMAFDNAAVAALRLRQVDRALHFAEHARRSWSGTARTADEKLWVVQGLFTNCRLLLLADRTEDALQIARRARAVADDWGITAARELADLAETTASFVAGIGSFEAMERIVDSADGPSGYWNALDAVIMAYDKAGYVDHALQMQRRLLGFTRKQKFEEVRALFGRPSLEELEATTKLARLDEEVHKRIANLVNSAINQSLRAGYDHGRIFRVGRLAELFCETLGWSRERIESVSLGSRLIDLGNIVIASDLLSKMRALSDGERTIVAEHAKFGADLLANAQLRRLDPCVPIVRYHHERWSGGGPENLAEERIPVEARLVSLCDAFDALTHKRPWRAAKPVRVALRIIEREAGTRFDPQLAERFVAWLRMQERPFFDSLGAESSDNEYVRMRRRLDELMRDAA